jgi:hypothetical protein
VDTTHSLEVARRNEICRRVCDLRRSASQPAPVRFCEPTTSDRTSFGDSTRVSTKIRAPTLAAWAHVPALKPLRRAAGGLSYRGGAHLPRGATAASL